VDKVNAQMRTGEEVNQNRADYREPRSFQDLIVWQKGIELVKDVYRLTANLPGDERFGLKDQARRSAVSIPANIAEGASRGHTREFLQFLAIANDSLAELKTYFVLLDELKMVDISELRPVAQRSQEVGRLLNGLQNSLKKKLVAKKQAKTIPDS
jgi:four helix bundle protein